MQNTITNLKQYITAGKAIFTVNNVETGNRFTYKVTKKENDDKSCVYFVSTLTGPCNESNYSYIGLLTQNGVFRHTTNSAVAVTALSFIAFKWLAANVSKVIPTKVEIRHEGRCGRCGRKLTTPKSIDAGFGPECVQHV